MGISILRPFLHLAKSGIKTAHSIIYNTLNYLHNKSLEYSDELAESVVMLADIMRYSLRESIEWASLEEEIRHMKLFIELHQTRYAHQLHVDFSVNGLVNHIRIIPFLLIGLLENAFKHGQMMDPKQPFIMRIDVVGSYLKVFTCNPKNMKNRAPSTRIGLANTKRRLDLVYNQFVFEIEDEEKTFCLTMSFDTNDIKETHQSIA